MDAEYIVAANAFFPVPLAAMQAGTLAPVDLYICVKPPDRLVLYKKARDPLTDEIRERLMANGVASLYLRNEDEAAYHTYVEENLAAIVRDDLLPRDQACQMVYESSNRVMKDVFTDPRSGRNLKRATSMVEVTVQAILKDPDTLWQMTAVASRDFQTYQHCVNSAMFLVGACRHVLGIWDQARLRQIGLGAIFHDVGMTRIPEQIVSKPDKLTDEEYDRVKQHPLIGLEMVGDRLKLGRLAGQIIRSHHERPDGRGYPDGLTDEQIDRIVGLSSIVDVYDSLTADRPHRPAKTPFEALRMMTGEMPGQFDPAMAQAFVKFLGPGDGAGAGGPAPARAGGDWKDRLRRRSRASGGQ